MNNWFHLQDRISWPEYAMQLAEVAAKRSEDPWYKVGACVLRKDHTVAATGYNGAPPGVQLDWSDRDKRRDFVLHAEMNCLNYVMPGDGELIAVTLLPCSECLKLIAAKRIKTVYYRELPQEEGKAPLNEKSFKVAKQFGIAMIELKGK